MSSPLVDLHHQLVSCCNDFIAAPISFLKLVITIHSQGTLEIEVSRPVPEVMEPSHVAKVRNIVRDTSRAD